MHCHPKSQLNVTYDLLDRITDVPLSLLWAKNSAKKFYREAGANGDLREEVLPARQA